MGNLYPYVILGDGDTLDTVDSCHIYFLTESGSDWIADHGRAGNLPRSMVAHRVSLADLVDLYLQAKGGGR